MDRFEQIEQYDAAMEQAEEAMASQNLDEAERWYQEAVRLAESFEDEPSSTIESMLGVASVKEARGETDSAIAVLDEAFEFALDHSSPADELPVEVAVRIMDLRRAQGREDMIEECLSRLITAAEESGEFDGPSDIYNQLGVYFQIKDKLIIAERLFQRALDEWPASENDESNGDYAVMLANLAEVRHDLGDDERAEPMLKRALEIYDRDEETDPISHAHALKVYADMLECSGREDEAEELKQRAETIAPPQSEDLIYQMTVTYDSMPQLDLDRLAEDINALDPLAPACRIISTFTPEKSSDGLEILSAVLAVDEIPNFILLHNVPTPDGPTRALIEMAVVEGLREKLDAHESFALVTGVDPDMTYDPMDRLIAMTKIAVALGKQGATGILNSESGIIFPAEFLSDAIKPEMWDSLRESGGPADLITGFLPLYTDEDELWFVSSGHGFHDLPDLAIKLEEGQNAEDTFLTMRTLFQEVFYYLYQNGDVIESGHSMEIGERKLHFSAPTPEQEEFLSAPCGRLIVTVE